MEYESIHYDFELSYIDQLHECSLETSFSFENDQPIFPSTIEDTEVDIERLLQIEKDLMDFDFLDQDTMIGIQNVEETVLLGDTIEMNIQEVQQNMDFPAEENFHEKMFEEDEVLEESCLTDLLLIGAEAVEAENWLLVSTVISKLNNLLLFNKDNGRDEPLMSLALFFTQGLQYKTINASEMLFDTVSKPPNNMFAFQFLQELSPYVKFAHFTANQAILDATQGDQKVHVIDFDIMEGIQWPSLMVDLSTRNGTSLRITAIIGHDQISSVTVQQTGRRLKEFADSINLHFVFEEMVMIKEEDFQSIEVGHSLIVNCMIHQLHMSHRSSSLVQTFLSGVTKLSPKIIVLVEEELFNFTKIPFMSFSEFFCEALHHYTALSDSLISGFCGGYKLAIRLIEKELLGTRILDSLRQFPCEKREKKLWEDGFSSLKEFRPIPMSACNVSQAKFLVSLFNSGYWVQHEQCRLALCWKSRPVTSASIWIPKSKPRPARSTSF